MMCASPSAVVNRCVPPARTYLSLLYREDAARDCEEEFGGRTLRYKIYLNKCDFHKNWQLESLPGAGGAQHDPVVLCYIISCP